MSKKPWKGRFKEATSTIMERFSQSVSFDKRLYEQDIRGSVAHARMLAETGIISHEDAEVMIRGLDEILLSIREGTFSWDETLEDVHMNIEAALTRKIGDAGARLHTARSRNDQVALDLRMYVRDETNRMRKRIIGLMEAVLGKARAHTDYILPGYTHLQRAQPVMLSHHLMAYFEMFRRDFERFSQVLASVETSPLGSGALAGTPLNIDRVMTAEELGFTGTTRNSMDAVSDRDFAAEFLFAAALCQVHLSRLAEEIVIWASSEFSFIHLPDTFSTGSSMMPQKRNPDAAELVRGKTGRTIGNLTALLVTMKGLPMTYNRDMQEDKEPLFDSMDTLAGSLEVMTGLLSGIEFDKERMGSAARGGFTTATDLADYLAGKGLPFRKAHEVVGRLVSHCAEAKCQLADLTLEEMTSFSDLFDEDVFKVITVGSSIEGRDIPGGTSPKRVETAMEEARVYLEKLGAD